MTWALKRQLFYVGVLIVFFLVFGFLIIFPYVNDIPSCVDNKQNGNEAGVDCGGSCIKACTFEVDEVSILWSRVFQVVPGRYNAVALFENHNKNTAIYKIKYKFRFSDKDNIYIGKREGETFVPPSGKFAIFEAGIGVGNSIPVYTSFEFTETPLWNNVSQDKIDQLKVSVSNIKLENQDTSPRLYATVRNDSLFNIPEVGVVALLYDEKGNVVSSSRTYLDILGAEETKDISFTWPESIKGNIVSKEIIPMYNIFLVKLK
ncbi:hypothetical protein COX93_03370 [Candidatus Nomurabacteria bacterium CG_4_10_14_0_2_um_filter_30_12]|uniref:Glucose/sorbosone dehydrogenase n=1 Tax=Candidatus Nomurabacteria bacterium CG_4_10_14_0_2_um_filter_30_12 TaxID=1974727 RepID=A0A2J0MEY4_9BACT|nr:MAG: hypothetical protein COX93_03370 [Candidatus Nomurabacteria bacterium CG_4_10_14_0_2_um_filter_30_12]